MKPSFLFLTRAMIHVDGSFLLARQKGADYTYLPGGHVEFGEPALQALQRELLEELGLPCEVGPYLGAVEHAWKQDEMLQHEINHVFEVKVTSLSASYAPRSLEQDLEFVWSPAGELERHNLKPGALIPLLRNWSTGNRSIGWASTL